MPISQSSPMLLTRNLLYTGMTRAKKLLIIIDNLDNDKNLIRMSIPIICDDEIERVVKYIKNKKS